MQLSPRESEESDETDDPSGRPVSETPHLGPESISSGQLLVMSIVSFFIYVGLALLLFVFFHDQGAWDVLHDGDPLTTQLWIGLLAGSLAAGIIIWLSSRPPLSKVLEDFTIVRVVMNNRFTAADRTQVSLTAGVGEEILFRGAIQPLLGIWFTSFIFIAIHGYFKFRSAGHILFGILMFSLSMMLGILFEWVGLVSAMAAHAIYDLLLLWWVDGRGKLTPKEGESAPV